VVADLADVKDGLSPLAVYSNHIQIALVLLTLVGVIIMLWARWDDRRRGIR
jgi:hypothetical protein